jgi:uncharacterized membrane protein YuzA (DUF378 family)
MILKGPRPIIDRPTQALILFGGICVGLIGIFDFDLLHWLFGRWESSAQAAIGVSAVWQTLRQRW